MTAYLKDWRIYAQAAIVGAGVWCWLKYGPIALLVVAALMEGK